MRITIDDVLRLNPCKDYDSARLEQLAAGRESVTLTEITELPIPFEDILWVVTRLLSGKHDRELRLFACDCAEHVLPLFEEKHPDDTIPREAINVARRYANGEATENELAVASDAACAAASAAAWASDVLAASDAASAAEQKWQLNKLREYLKEIEK
jgi:hypothetical protein